MNANLYQSARPPTKTIRSARTVSKTSKVSSVDPLARCKTWLTSHDQKWINNYTEEWVAFFKEKSTKKPGAASSRTGSQALPRVWNIPRE